ncbi:hypothetical protein BDV93DRAFT_602686 [Ceratobasidium sp. AG-I]|nr:hypothetical protein BDV93DRAFT_602686 [Ceratobasidium sp. AG-I]
MTSMNTESSVSIFKVTSHYTPSDNENGTNIVSYITHLVDSYFIWVGGTNDKPDSALAMFPPASGGPLSDDVENETSQAWESKSIELFVAQVMQGGLVAKDWACAMPSKQVSLPVLGTSIFRTGDSDESLAISQRLARRFQKQILLSLDIPVGVRSSGQTSFFLLQVEKHLLMTLKSFNH